MFVCDLWDWIRFGLGPTLGISGNYDACSSNRDLFQSFLLSIDNFELSPNGSGKNLKYRLWYSIIQSEISY